MELLTIFISVMLGAMGGFAIAKWMYTTALQNILEILNISEDDLRKVADEMGIEVPARETQTIEIDGETFEYDDYVEVRVEKIDNIFFAYRDDNDVFIAQSADPDELVDALINHFPAKTRVNIDPDNGGKYLKDLA